MCHVKCESIDKGAVDLQALHAKVAQKRLSGQPVEKIMKEAASAKVSLIIMGSHRPSALAAMVPGSVTCGVIHKVTKIPVMIVKR